MQAGDDAFWAPMNVMACDARFIDTYKVKAQAGGLTIDRSYFGSAIETRQLCYRFQYLGANASHILSEPTAYLLFPSVRATTLGAMRASPTGAAVGCAANVTILGRGFNAVSDVLAKCVFGSFGSTEAKYVSDTEMSCESPTVDAAGTAALHLQFGVEASSPLLLVQSVFTFYDSSSLVVDHVTPSAGPYDTAVEVQLSGSLLDFGAPSCRFGAYASVAVVSSKADAQCTKPAFPASEKAALGAYPLEFSPDGQCWVSSASFTTYNAMVISLSVTGSPSTASVPLLIHGEGLIALPSARCEFVADGTADAIYRPLTVISSTEAMCETPANGAARSYEVRVQLNGVTSDPNLNGTLSLSEYDLSAVTLSALSPQYVPLGETTSLTVDGTGFASYGAGQLVCRAGSLIVPGLLLDSTQVVCELPATLPAGTLSVNVSLSGGIAGTFSQGLDLFVYPQPIISTVAVASRRALSVYGASQAQGDAMGGTPVAVIGTGFEGLIGAGFEGARTLVRCRFGARGSPSSEATVVSDSEVRCLTTPGTESDDGQPVAVALNAISFAGNGTFYYIGLHTPFLVSVRFTPDLRKLVIQLDEQPTNRGNVNGQVRCERLLSDATAEALRGDAPEAICAWQDDSTIVAFLTTETYAEPGMVVTLRAGVIWPKLFTGACTGSESRCNAGDEMSVDTFFPCNRVDTEETELCDRPVAVVRAPMQISACAGTTLELDGSHSHGGGPKPLKFFWNPAGSSDNRRNIKSYAESELGRVGVYQQCASIRDSNASAVRRKQRAAPVPTVCKRLPRPCVC